MYKLVNKHKRASRHPTHTQTAQQRKCKHLEQDLRQARDDGHGHCAGD